MQFTAYKAHKKHVEYLTIIRQKPNESTQAYLTYLINEATNVEGLSNEAGRMALLRASARTLHSSDLSPRRG